MVNVSVDCDDAAAIKRVISARINSATYFLCIVGEKTHKSGWVAWEIAKAVDLRKKIVAVKTAKDNTTPTGLDDYSTMEQTSHILRNGLEIVIREAKSGDARVVLDYIREVSGESDFLTFGPGEFELSEREEKDFLEKCRKTKNQLCIIGLINGTIVSVLSFSGGKRPRIMHCGDLGISVQKQHWGAGIGSLMLDIFIEWAKFTNIIKKINLRVRTDNKRAISLYEQKGFVTEGTIRKEIFIDGHFFDHHWMSYEIDD